MEKLASLSAIERLSIGPMSDFGRAALESMVECKRDGFTLTRRKRSDCNADQADEMHHHRRKISNNDDQFELKSVGSPPWGLPFIQQS